MKTNVFFINWNNLHEAKEEVYPNKNVAPIHLPEGSLSISSIHSGENENN